MYIKWSALAEIYALRVLSVLIDTIHLYFTKR